MNWRDALQESEMDLIKQEDGTVILEGDDEYLVHVTMWGATFEGVPSAEYVQRVLEEFGVSQEGWK